jgi:hypothetical protein
VAGLHERQDVDDELRAFLFGVGDRLKVVPAELRPRAFGIEPTDDRAAHEIAFGRQIVAGPADHCCGLNPWHLRFAKDAHLKERLSECLSERFAFERTVTVVDHDQLVACESAACEPAFLFPSRPPTWIGSALWAIGAEGAPTSIACFFEIGTI